MVYHVDVEKAVEQYADMVYRLALARTANATDAEDVFSEVFLRLVKYADTIESDEHLKAWLLRVTVNCAYKQVGSTYRKRTSSLDDANPADASFSQAFPSDSPVPAAIQALPEKYRTVVHLYYYEDYSVKHIAEMINKPENTVKSLLSRARAQLKDILEEAGEG